MKFNFTSSIVVEASSAEDALSSISYRLSVISRHISEPDVTLADNAPFFTLTPVVESSPAGVTDLAADPIVAENGPYLQPVPDEAPAAPTEV